MSELNAAVDGNNLYWLFAARPEQNDFIVEP